MYTLDVSYLWYTHGVTIDQQSTMIPTLKSTVFIDGPEHKAEAREWTHTNVGNQ